MYRFPSYPMVFFDVDDTLVFWDKDPGEHAKDKVEIVFRHHVGYYTIHRKHVDLLVSLAQRGHNIVVWSRGGVDWATAVVEALDIEPYVEAVCSKPTYYIDDQKDPTKWMGTHSYIEPEKESA